MSSARMLFKQSVAMACRLHVAVLERDGQTETERVRAPFI